MPANKFEVVLRDELEAVRQRRLNLKINQEQVKGATLDELREEALNMGLVGLAFSGGGIRSGTLAVGFLQGLAKLKLLRVFDYLSTVSGGGYAGSWLAGWIKRETDARIEREIDAWTQRQLAAGQVPSLSAEQRRAIEKEARQYATESVEHQLDPSRKAESAIDRWLPAQPPAVGETWRQKVVDQEPEPLHHLRAYSRYLAPQVGMFSADSWTLIASYLRNTAITLFVISMFTMAVLFASRWLIWGFAQAGELSTCQKPWTQAISAVGIALAAMAILAMSWYRGLVVLANSEPKALRDASEPPRWRFIAFIVLPLLVVSVIACWSLGLDPVSAGGSVTLDSPTRFSEQAPMVKNSIQNVTKHLPIGSLIALYALKFILPASLLALVAFMVRAVLRCVCNPVSKWRICQYRFGWPDNFFSLISNVVLVTATGAALAVALRYLVWPLAIDEGPAAVVTLGPPIVLAAFMLGGLFETMVFARFLWKYELEWRGRVLGYLFMVAAGWLAFFGATIYLPAAISCLAHSTALSAVKPIAIIGWVFTTIGGLIAGNKPPAPGAGNRILGVLRVAAPPIFIAGYLALLSVLTAEILREHLACGPGTKLALSTSARQGCWIAWAFLISLVSTLVLNGLISANDFSVHDIYMNRLVRCYLGASRPKQCVGDDPNQPSFPGGAPTGVDKPQRRENPVTGFDPNDDLHLAELQADRYPGPYPLFNASIELVAGDQLAWQDRKAASFTLTPRYWGCDGTWWAQTPKQGKTVFTLGRAMAISGAAVDSNMAAYQSTSLTVLLTIFNARTGIWLWNPKDTDSKPRGTVRWWFGLPVGLIYELMGHTNEKSTQIRVADGGHFENLGVYELIRRRCRFIVTCDFAEDHSDASENLANMIRLVRIDFGIRIEIDTSPVRENDKGICARHVATGIIHYEDVDQNAVTGTLLFIRSSLTGDESPDIRQYAETHANFPHDSTANQFFDADEFEAYRALGEHMASVVFENGQREIDWSGTDIAEPIKYRRAVRRLFAKVRHEWYPQPAEFLHNYNDTGGLFDKFIGDLRGDPKLAPLVRGLYPELDELSRAGTANTRKAKLAPELQELCAELTLDEGDTLLTVNQILNVMETAWITLRLTTYCFHPFNRGWINEFRRWSAAEDFQRFWPILRGEYSPGFVRFCEMQLNAPIVGVKPIQFDFNNLDHEKWLTKLNDEFLIEWCEAKIHWERIEKGDDKQVGDVAGLEPYKDFRVALNEPLHTPLVIRCGAGAMTWFATIPIGPGNDYPIGILTLYPRSNGSDIEVLMWLRGAYRSLGLGRNFAESKWEGSTLHDWIESQLLAMFGDKVKLFTRYTVGLTGLERLQETMWSTFFYDYEFRRRPAQSAAEAVEDKYFIVLRRIIP